LSTWGGHGARPQFDPGGRSNSGKDRQLREFATKTLPTLEQHLQHAEQAASAVGRSSKKGSTSNSGTR